MTQFYIPQEDDFKKWIKESVNEVLSSNTLLTKKEEEKEPLMNRQQMANELGVSLVTITDWMKKGLPFHRLNGRIYFLRSEVLKSMTHHHVKQ